MKRTKQRRTARWTDQNRPAKAPTPYADTPPPLSRETPRTAGSGLGPYESTYDVSHGYSLDRMIVLP
jgi:hypothetical protein